MSKKDANTPARIRFRALPSGRREDKFAALATLSLEGSVWADCASGWREPFLPASGKAWASYPALDDMFVYNASGVMPGRTWVIAPDAASLRERWSILTHEKDAAKRRPCFIRICVEASQATSTSAKWS
jgi:hypothetical protein